MKKIGYTAILDNDNYPFSIDVIMPEKDVREEVRKYRDNIIREFSERMFYWVLPWFSISMLIVSYLNLWSIFGFITVVTTLISSGLVMGRVKKNRCFMYAFGFFSYAMIVPLAIFFAPVL